MDLSLGELQKQSVNAFRRLLEREGTTARVRAAEPLGFDAALWRSVVDMGLPAMGVPESLGGLGLELLDMALIAEVHGEFLASVPLIESMVATRLLARCGRDGEVLLASALEGGLPLAVVLNEVQGAVPQLVPAGAVAPILVGLDGAELVAVRSPPPGVAATNIMISDRGWAIRLESRKGPRRNIRSQSSWAVP